MRTILLVIVLWGCAVSRNGNFVVTSRARQAQRDTFLTHLLAQYPQYFDSLLKKNDVWHIQIVYAKIDRNWRNKPRFTNYFFNTDSQYYFYPASTVKLPVAVLALQRLHELNKPGLNKFTTMITESSSATLTAVFNDPTTADGRPNIAHYIKKIFLVSDNDAFNRLYEFLGQEYINNTLHRMGWDSVQILHRLNMTHLTEAENRLTNPVAFYDTAARMVYRKPAQNSTMVYQPRHDLLGKGYYYDKDSLILEPFDFSKKNRLPLTDLHDILLRVLFPKAIPKKQRFHLNKDDYAFLHKYMSMAPRESRHPEYDSTFNDAYAKFLFYGAHDSVQPGIRIFNKIGDAYGFLTDAAYIIDTKNKVEFMVSATINCNSNGVFNYDATNFDAVGFPFMKHLGRVLYQYELTRPRRHKPNFKELLKSSMGF